MECGSCHAQNAKNNPERNATARYLRSSLLELADDRQKLRPEAEELGERGLDAEPVLASIEELNEAIVQTRSRVHTFDRGGFDHGAKLGRDAVAKSESLVEAARKEQRYRRNVLLVSIGLMAFLAVAMGFKAREIGRRRARKRRGPAHPVRRAGRSQGRPRGGVSTPAPREITS
jgi:hypothetical protein